MKKTPGCDATIVNKIEKAIPIELPKWLSGTMFSTLTLGIQSAMKPLVDKMQYSTRDVMNAYNQVGLESKLPSPN